MDDALKRRLVGAAVLLLAAFGLSLLLPGPDHSPGEGAAPVVAYDLRTGEPLNLPPAQPAPPPLKLKPVEIGGIEAPKPESGPGSEPESGKEKEKIGAPAPDIPKNAADSAKPAPKPAADSAKPAPKPQTVVAATAATAPAPAKPAAASTQVMTKPASKPGRPALKVDESFGVKGGDAWYVQIGSFASKDNARAEQMKLAKLGLPAILQGITVDKKLWYRVRVGPYQAEAPAQQALTTVRTHGYAAAKVARPEGAAN